MVDPAFVVTIALPDLSPAEVMDHSVDDGMNVLRVRYTYTGQLDPIAQRMLGGRELALVQTVSLDPETTTGTLTLVAEAEPNRLHGNATITIAAMTTGARRVLDGEFTVKVPLMGGAVERRLLPGILARFDVEADATAAKLSG